MSELLGQWIVLGSIAVVWLMAAITFNLAGQSDWFLDRFEKYPAKERALALGCLLVWVFLLGPLGIAAMMIKTYNHWRKRKS